LYATDGSAGGGNNRVSNCDTAGTRCGSSRPLGTTPTLSAARSSVEHLGDDVPGAILAGGGLILAFDDMERLHDVAYVVAGDLVEVEVQRV
jgi:hypothetical protein